MKQDTTPFATLQLTIRTGDELNGSLLAAAHAVGKERDDLLVLGKKRRICPIQQDDCQRGGDWKQGLWLMVAIIEYAISQQGCYLGWEKSKWDGEGGVIPGDRRVGRHDVEDFVLQTLPHKGRIGEDSVLVILEGHTIKQRLRRIQ